MDAVLTTYCLRDRARCSIAGRAGDSRGMRGCGANVLYSKTTHAIVCGTGLSKIAGS